MRGLDISTIGIFNNLATRTWFMVYLKSSSQMVFVQVAHLGSIQKKMFDKGNSWRAQSLLDLVHSDVVGPFLVPSFGKSRYALTFIDDYSHYTWVFFMAHKSEVFEKFLTFKAQ